MNPATFEQFEAQARAAGYDEVIQREWQPDLVLDSHRHPFEVKALVVQGEVWLNDGQCVRHLHAGDSFELDRDAPHTERYGPEGAVFWVARRHAPRPD